MAHHGTPDDWHGLLGHPLEPVLGPTRGRTRGRMTTSMMGAVRMGTLFMRMRFAAGALALAFIVACAAPVAAQPRNPDGSVNPTASSVKEDQLLGAFDRITGRCTIPDQK